MEVFGAVPVTPSARIGGLIVLTVACVAGAEASVGAQPGPTGWTVSVVAGSLFGGALETGVREPTYVGAVGLGVGPGVSLEAEVAVTPELRQFGDIELLIGTGSLLYHPFTAGRLTPYGLLGASLARFSSGLAGAESEVELALGSTSAGESGCGLPARSRSEPTSGSSTLTTRRTSGALLPASPSRLESRAYRRSWCDAGLSPRAEVA